MKKKILDNFPTPEYILEPLSMSKRLYVACMAMQGILANHGKSNNPVIEDSDRYYDNIVKHSYMIADKILEQEHWNSDEVSNTTFAKCSTNNQNKTRRK